MPWDMLKRTNRLPNFEMSLPVNRFGGFISFWRVIIPLRYWIRFTVINWLFQRITTVVTAETLGLEIIYPRRIPTFLHRAVLVELWWIRWIQCGLLFTILLRLYAPLFFCQEKVSIIIEETTFFSWFLRTF